MYFHVVHIFIRCAFTLFYKLVNHVLWKQLEQIDKEIKYTTQGGKTAF